MSPTQAVILAVALAVIVDIGFMFWVRRRNPRKRVLDHRSVSMFGSYSPVLTWFKVRGWRKMKGKHSTHNEKTPSSSPVEIPLEAEEMNSIAKENTKGETEILEQRITELEGQVRNLEQELNLVRESGNTPVDLRSKIKPMLFFLTAIFLAATPSYLVFRNRWLGIRDVITPFNELWNQVWRDRNPGLPPYFATVIICVVALLLLILIYRQRFPIETKRPAFASVTDRGSLPKREAPNQLRLSRWLLLGAFLITGSTFIYGLVTKQVVSLGFFIGLCLYILGWCSWEISFDEVNRIFRENWEVITSFLLFHFSLILLLGNFASQWNFDWGFVILFVLSLINLLRYYRRIPPIIWVVNLAIVLYAININSWAFSVVGDEYSFYERGQEISERWSIALTLSNFFNGQWVYGAHTFFSSFLQGLSMSLFGSNSFGWRFSSLYLAALSVGFFYYVNKSFLPRTTAFIAALFMAFSSYLMTFGKIGYNNLQALFALSVTMCAATWVIRSKRLIAFATMGMSLGLCFYVYPAALTVAPIPLLLLLFYFPPKSKAALYGWGILLVSAMFLILPLFLQPGYWQSKIPGLWMYNPKIGSTLGESVYHIGSNFLLALFSYLYIVDETHFVAAAYTDPLTAMFVLFGLVLAVKQVRRERFVAFLLVSFILTLFLVGVSHDRKFPPNTRMFLLLPWFTVFASIGLLWVVERVKALQVFAVSQTSMIAFVMIGVLGFNLYQAYPLSKIRSVGHQHFELLFTRLIQERLKDYEIFNLYPKTFLFITDKNWGIDGFHMLERVYSYPASRIYLQRVELNEPELPDSATELIENRNTLVIIQPTMNPDWQETISSSLQSLGKIPCEIKEYSNRDTRFVMWYSPEVSALCPSMP
jgi:hypothetical protein